MTTEELDLESIRYTEEFDAERPRTYPNIHEQEVSISERQQAYQDGFHAAIDFVTKLINAKSNIINASSELLREIAIVEPKEEPYCLECGGEDLRYLATYANGDEYKCKHCKHEAVWPK
jgi:hypothetical protein